MQHYSRYGRTAEESWKQRGKQQGVHDNAFSPASSEVAAGGVQQPSDKPDGWIVGLDIGALERDFEAAALFVASLHLLWGQPEILVVQPS